MRVLPLTLVLLLHAGMASAADWTPVDSGTNESITAIEYQSADRFWFTTGTGQIFRRVDGRFREEHSAGFLLDDIEFQDGGQVGLAVGAGRVLRSTDGGASWAEAHLPDWHAHCIGLADGRGSRIRFASAGDAWIVGMQGPILRSTGTPASVGATWTDVQPPGTPCELPIGAEDAYFPPGSSSGYFVIRGSGRPWFSDDRLATPAFQRPANAVGGFRHRVRLAGDPANPGRMWTVQPDDDALKWLTWRTTDGWATSSRWVIHPAGFRARPSNVDYAGGTVLATAWPDAILSSIDGANFYVQRVQGLSGSFGEMPVSIADAAHAAVGGQDGVLMVTSHANVVPETVPPPAGDPGTNAPRIRARFAAVRARARRAGRVVRVHVAGMIRLPDGLTRARSCRGIVRATVRKHRRALASRRARLRPSCRFSTSVAISRRRVGAVHRLRVTVRFRGNATLAARSIAVGVRIRR